MHVPVAELRKFGDHQVVSGQSLREKRGFAMRFKSDNAIAFDASLIEKRQGSRVSLGSLLEAVSEGFNKAERYERLTRESTAELAALGLRRENLPRVVMFGKP
jgi:hypothetical protein